MIITKSFLRHEVQNILMILGFYLDEFEKENKLKMQDLIKRVSLFIEYEDLFLDNNFNFYKQKMPVSDVFEIVLASNEDCIKARNLKIKVEESTAEINIDRESIVKALVQVFSKVLENTSLLKIQFNEKQNFMQLLHNGGVLDFNKKTFDYILKKKKSSYKEIMLQVSLHLLSLFKCSLKSNSNELIILFPE